MKNQNSSNWIAIQIIGVIIIVTLFSCTTSSKTSEESVSNSPTPSRLSTPVTSLSSPSNEFTPISNPPTPLNEIMPTSESSTASNSSYSNDTVYFNGHHYKIFPYPSSFTDYEASKSYATKACNNLDGYFAVLDVGEESEFVGEFIAIYQKEHPDETFFVCEWDN